MSEIFYVVPEEQHNALVTAAYKKRGYSGQEAAAGARFCAEATRHGIRTHNALKALHLDHLFGSGAGGCVPKAKIEKVKTRFRGSQVWNANRKLGQSTAYAAIETAIRLADRYGIGVVAVDNAFHYLWGGGYVMEAARRGYIAYTNCTSAAAEVVPFGGRFPTVGTNPHSWGFPTVNVVGFPIVIDWATSAIASGRVQQCAREGKPLPPEAALDAEGNYTTDPARVAALVPMGGRLAGHKGWGLALIDELYAAYIGGSLPTIRGLAEAAGRKGTSAFFFQAIHPDAIASAGFASPRDRDANVKDVLSDIRGHGNEKALLPGELEA